MFFKRSGVQTPLNLPLHRFFGIRDPGLASLEDPRVLGIPIARTLVIWASLLVVTLLRVRLTRDAHITVTSGFGI